MIFVPEDDSVHTNLLVLESAQNKQWHYVGKAVLPIHFLIKNVVLEPSRKICSLELIWQSVGRFSWSWGRHPKHVRWSTPLRCLFFPTDSRKTDQLCGLVTGGMSTAYTYEEMRQLQLFSILEWLYSQLTPALKYLRMTLFQTIFFFFHHGLCGFPLLLIEKVYFFFFLLFSPFFFSFFPIFCIFLALKKIESCESQTLTLLLCYFSYPLLGALEWYWAQFIHISSSFPLAMPAAVQKWILTLPFLKDNIHFCVLELKYTFVCWVWVSHRPHRGEAEENEDAEISVRHSENVGNWEGICSSFFLSVQYEKSVVIAMSFTLDCLGQVLKDMRYLWVHWSWIWILQLCC